MSILNKKITIYEGTIKKLYIDNVILSKDQITVLIKQETVSNNALFRKGIFDYISLEHDTVLPTKEEANDYMQRVFYSKKDTIQQILENKIISEEDKQSMINDLKNISSCIYLSNEVLKPISKMDKNKIKQYKK